MKSFILVSDGMEAKLFEELQQTAGLEVFPESKVKREKIKELGAKVNALVIRSATTVDAELLEWCPNLKYVIRAGEGTDNIDKKSCALKGVKVSNTPGANANSAAEQAIALMFTTLRYTAQADASMKKGEWNKTAFTGLEMWKKTVGFVGFGNIAKIVARRLSGFEIQALFFDPFCASSDIPYAKKTENLNELFKTSDIVTVHTPLSDGTRDLIKAEQIGLMKKEAILINAARGGIVNEDALYLALKEKKIRAAGLDVFKTEPLPPENNWRELNNVVLAPHLGASTEEAQWRVGEMAVHQIKEFFLKNNLLNEVKAKA